MKRLFLFAVFALCLYANHISWMGDYSKALLIAKKEHKPLMILLVKKDCKSCNEIIARVFMDSPYIDILNQKVISVIVTKNSRVAYPIELLYSTDFPTLFFIDSKDEVFISEPFYGVVTREDMEKIIDKL